jgi:hypothetical protein
MMKMKYCVTNIDTDMQVLEKLTVFMKTYIYAMGKINRIDENLYTGFGKINLFYGNSDPSFGKMNLFYENLYCMRERFVNFYSHGLLRRCAPRNDDGLLTLRTQFQRRPSLRAQRSNPLFSDFVSTKHDIINSYVCLAYSIYAGFGKITGFMKNLHVGFGKTNLFYANFHVGFGKTNLFYQNLHVGFGKTNLFYANLHVGFGKTGLFCKNLHIGFCKINRISDCLIRKPFPVKYK